MKRVIITGGTGFIGSNLVRRLLMEGHQIHFLVRPGSSLGRIRAIRKDVHLHQADLQDTKTVEKAVRQIRPDWVFHLAAHGAYSWQSDLARMVQTNLVGTINLVEACLRTGFETFINTGSSSEYGFKTTAPAETEMLEPNSAYAVTKASASLYCRNIAQSRRVRLFTLRPYSVYGPYEEPRRLMPTLIRYGLSGKLPPLVDPDTARDYIYVEDMIDAYLSVAAKPDLEPGAIYNVGSGVQTTLREVVKVACRVLGLAVEPEWGTMPPRIWDTDTWVANIQKLQKELGFYPHYTFEQGFRELVAWFSDNPHFLDEI